MKKIGITSAGSVIVEMTTDEYKMLTALPPKLTQKSDSLAAEAIREANENGEMTDYNYRTLSHLFADDGKFHGLTVVEMLTKIEFSAPKYRLLEYRGLNPRVVKTLRDVLEKKKLA